MRHKMSTNLTEVADVSINQLKWGLISCQYLFPIMGKWSLGITVYCKDQGFDLTMYYLLLIRRPCSALPYGIQIRVNTYHWNC